MHVPRILVCLVPVLVYLLWLGIRLLLGKRPSRFEVTTGLSLLLLLYFLFVVGTGIFWVAAQELPIFDWHYLPGYILLLMGLAHTALHWGAILRFMRSRTPESLVAPGGATFRPWLRGMGYGFLVLLGATALFMIGRSTASQRLAFSGGTEDVVNLKADSREGGPIEPRRLKASPVSVSLAEFYNAGCSYPNAFNLPGLTIRTRPAVLKDYPELPRIPLPAASSDGGPQVLAAFRDWCAGKGQVSAALDVERLSHLLFHAQGISKTLQFGPRTFDLRTAPSAGGLFPVNLYVLVRAIPGIEPGVYYYHPKESALVRVKAGDPVAALAEASGSPSLLRTAPATVVYTATFARTAFKYRERAYRYVNDDAGHAAYNLALGAAAAGLRAPLIGRFDDALVNGLLGLNAQEEGALLLQPLGAGPEAEGQEPRFVPAPMGNAKASFLDLIHGGTSMKIGRTVGARLRFPAGNASAPGLIALPAPAEGRPLFEAIRSRRSVREYSGKPMELAELSALCAAATPVEGSDPFLSGSAPLNLYLAVRNVNGLPAGIYRYLPKPHALERLQAGDFSGTVMRGAFQQDFCGTANVVFLKTVEWEGLTYPDGDRGYRYAHLRAGFVGEGLYLQGTALGIGVCGVGAYGDAEIAKLLKLDPAKELVLYLTAAGKL